MKAVFKDSSTSRYSVRPPSSSMIRIAPRRASAGPGKRAQLRAPAGDRGEVGEGGAGTDEVVADLASDPRHDPDD